MGSPSLYSSFPPELQSKIAEEEAHLSARIVSDIENACATGSQQKLLNAMRHLSKFVDLSYNFSETQLISLVSHLYSIIFCPSAQRPVNLSRLSYFVSSLPSLLDSLYRQNKNAIVLPWRPFYEALEASCMTSIRKKSTGLFMREILGFTDILCIIKYARKFFPASAVQEIMEEMRPKYHINDSELDFAVMSTLILLPTQHMVTAEVLASSSEHSTPTVLREFFGMLDWHPANYGWLKPFFFFFDRLHRASQSLETRVDLFSDLQKERIFAATLRSLDLPVSNYQGHDAAILSNGRFALMDSAFFQLKLTGATISSSALTPAAILSRKSAKLIISWLTPSMEEEENPSFVPMQRILKVAENYLHPSSHGNWVGPLFRFVLQLTIHFSKRVQRERRQTAAAGMASDSFLTEGDVRQFVELIYPLFSFGLYSKDPSVSNESGQLLAYLSVLSPDIVLPRFLEIVPAALQTLEKTHQTKAVIAALQQIVNSLFRSHDRSAKSSDLDFDAETGACFKGREIADAYLPDILTMTLPGIDSNDIAKTATTLSFYLSVLLNLPLISSSSAYHDDQPFPITSAMAEEWALQVVDRLFLFLENYAPPTAGSASAALGGMMRGQAFAGASTLDFPAGSSLSKPRDNLSTFVTNLLCLLFCQSSPSLQSLLLDKFSRFVRDSLLTQSVKLVGAAMSAITLVAPEKVLSRLFPVFYERLVQETPMSPSASSSSSLLTASLHSLAESESVWNISTLYHIAKASAHQIAASPVLKQNIRTLFHLFLTQDNSKNEAAYDSSAKIAMKLLKSLIATLTSPIKNPNRSIVPPHVFNSPEFQNGQHVKYWGKTYTLAEYKLEDSIAYPSQECIAFAAELIETFAPPALASIDKFTDSLSAMHDSASSSSAAAYVQQRKDLMKSLRITRSILRGAGFMLPEMTLEKETHKNIFANVFDPLADSKTAFSTLPSSSIVHSLRQRIASSLHRLIPALRQNRPDEVDAVRLICKTVLAIVNQRSEAPSTFRFSVINISSSQLKFDGVFYEDRCFRQLKSSSQQQQQQLGGVKRDPALFPVQRYPRYLATMIVTSAFIYRHNIALNRVLNCTPEYTLLLNDMISLSSGPYSRIRSQAQASLTAMVNRLPVKHTSFILPQALSILLSPSSAVPAEGAAASSSSAPAVSDEELTGAFYLIYAFSRRLRLNYNFFLQFLKGILQQAHLTRTTQVQRREELFSEMLKKLLQLPLVSSHVMEPFGGNKSASADGHNDILMEDVDEEDDDMEEHEEEDESEQNNGNGNDKKKKKKSLQPGYSSPEEYERIVNDIVKLAADPANVHSKTQLYIVIALKSLRRSDYPMPLSACEFLLKAAVTKEHVDIRNYALWTLSSVLVQYKTSHPKKTISPSALTGGLLRWKSEESPTSLPPPRNQQELSECSFFDKNYFGWYRLPSQCLVDDYSPEAASSYTPSQKPMATAEQRTAFTQLLSSTVLSSSSSGSFSWMNSLFQTVSVDLPGASATDLCLVMHGLAKTLGRPVLEQVKEHINSLVEKSFAQKQEEKICNTVISNVLSGLIRGAKHWNFQDSTALWDYSIPIFKRMILQCDIECVGLWTSALRNMSADRDPRRFAPLSAMFITLADESSSASPAVQARLLKLWKCSYSEFMWRNAPYTQQVVPRVLPLISSSYAQVRETAADMLQDEPVSLFQFPRDPATQLAVPFSELDTGSAAAVADDSKYLSVPSQLMQKLKEMRPEQFSLQQHTVDNPPPAQETQYKCLAKGVLLLLKRFMYRPWLYVPVLFHMAPELLKLLDVPNDEEILNSAKMLLGLGSCLVISQVSHIHRMLALFIDLCNAPSSSWRVRGFALNSIHILFFKHMFELKHDVISTRVLETTLNLLKDSQLEVREMTARFLSRLFMHAYKMEFEPQIAKFSKMAQTQVTKQSPPQNLLIRHAGVLGLSAIVNAFPYSIPPFLPSVLVRLASFASDSQTVIQATVRKIFADFWKSHRDNWAEEKLQFQPDELSSVEDLLLGPSYYA